MASCLYCSLYSYPTLAFTIVGGAITLYKKKKRYDTKKEATKIKSNNFTRNN